MKTATLDVENAGEDIFIHIDAPTPKKIPTTPNFPIQGWIIAQTPIERIEAIAVDGTVYNLDFMRRPDVEKVYPHSPYVGGFAGNIGRNVLQDNAFIFHCHTEGKVKKYHHIIKNAYPLTEEQKNNKLARILPTLACANCHHDMPYYRLPLPATLTCEACGSVFDFSDNRFNFLTEDLKQQFKIIDTENVSVNLYDGDSTAVSLIRRFWDGLILDCGAGKRNSDYPNVVNFEIVPYESTDVLGVGEKLPFKDNAFDAVFSFAVLEHVSDPFACAAELARVLKPGGVLYCVVPFLQPRHGYPNHFYNMSAQGLTNLFDKKLHIIESSVPRSGLPIFTLTWFLQSWVSGLNGKAQEEFLEMKVKDLIGNPIDYLNQPFIESLAEDKNFELASTTMIVAEKPAS